MSQNEAYFNTNKKLWNAKVQHHVKSDFYNMAGFLRGETSLRKIELALLPDLNGKKLLHPQCHFGQDTLSLERLGANCTGVDFSETAIQKAKAIRDQLGMKSDFIACNVYDMDKHVQDIFDYIFCSYGVITWLPDLNRWAHQLSKRLKHGGELIFVEFHPLLYMFDWDTGELTYEYFNQGKPESEVESGTYADNDADIALKEYFWMHSQSELIQALIDNGFIINEFKEYDYSPYKIFDQCKFRAEQEYVYKPGKISLPHVFSIRAQKA
ncbi:MAG: methyltransferase domain-containing protein [Bacteroidia bacterium]|nr:methyltransferase domain-containing protein [Bacteroidia bacterium]